jgi:uncharacterized protein DUF3892
VLEKGEMADVIVTNIEKAKSAPFGERIIALGNPNTPQGGWRWTAEQVIASIEAGTNTFFIRESGSGRRYDIHVLSHQSGVKILGTVDQGKPTEHLYQLSEFPSIASK